MLKYMLGGMMLVALVLPAAADFYIVRPSTQKTTETTKKDPANATSCMVVEKKPAPSTAMVLVNSNVYKTRAEAEAALKKAC